MRECLFQEDCNGQGAEICEVTFADGRVRRVREYLNEEAVHRLREDGVISIFLTYRGSRGIVIDRGVFRDAALEYGVIA